MKIVGFLKKQPKWKCVIDNSCGKIHTGYEGYAYAASMPQRIWCKNTSTSIPNPDYIPPDITEIDVPVVEATLNLVAFSRGRSSTVFIFECPDGHRYDTSPQASFEMFKSTVKGKITGLFTFKKQGSQISICPLEENTKWSEKTIDITV